MTDWVVSALLALLLTVLAANARAAGAALDSVAEADGCATVAVASTTPAEVGVVAASTVAGCVEFDSDLAGGDVDCWASGAGVGVLGVVGSGTTTGTVGALDGPGVSAPVVPSSGSVLTGAAAAVDPPGSVAAVCAPPLLLMVTPDATWVVDDVVPDVAVG